MEELNDKAKLLVRICPEIVNEFADRLTAEFSLEDLIASRVRPKILTPEEFRRTLETREE